MKRQRWPAAGFLLLIVLLGAISTMSEKKLNAQGQRTSLPRFEVDSNWPKQLPNNWMIGQVSGVAVDSRDHVWVVNRPGTLDDNDKYFALGRGDCCAPAPPIVEFDEAGNFIQGMGGVGEGYEWPADASAGGSGEHGIFVDYKDNVWTGGNGQKDTMVLKFTRNGKFLLQIGKRGVSDGSNDTANLKRAAGMIVDPKTNELYVADGYGNRRVIVFDADTGKYKRHWGAYGNRPDDSVPRGRTPEGPGPTQFNTVHAVRLSNDGLVYVADRANNRIQVFKPDGTFVKESYVNRKATGNEGTTFDLVFSPDREQRFIYVADGTDKKVQILDRNSLETLGSFGHGGRSAGQFYHLHSIGIDSKGNIFTGESIGARLQKFVYRGMSTTTTSSR